MTCVLLGVHASPCNLCSPCQAMHAVAMQACSPSHRAIDKHIHVLKLGQHCVCQVLALQGGGGTGELLTGVGLPGTGQMLGAI